jgi:putative transposase
MCQVLRVYRSGYYAWKVQPQSKRTFADESVMASNKRSFEDSQGIYGSPRIHCDLREESLVCGGKRVARLMRQAQLRSVRGYKRPRYRLGMPATTATTDCSANALSPSLTRFWALTSPTYAPIRAGCM